MTAVFAGSAATRDAQSLPGAEGSAALGEQVTRKAAGHDMSRIVSPESTLERVGPLMSAAGITRVATLTGLDRIGIPVVAVVRPNSRSYSVAQGKGITLEAAKASGVMESLENFHAEEVSLPLRLGSFSELRRQFGLVDVAGLPRLATSIFHEHLPILWAHGAVDLVSGESVLVPHEIVHLDFRVPHAQGSGCFLRSSNGLASGNHLYEALVHGLCELIERDANTLWQVSGEEAQRARRIDLETVDDPACRDLLARFADARVDVIAWDTTTEIGVPSVLCDVVDRDLEVQRPMPPVRGSGTHPCRRVALSRALTEAAQGRLTRISGSRDDLSGKVFDDTSARRMIASAHSLIEQRPLASFADMPDVEHGTVEDDLQWICGALRSAGFEQVIAVNLTRSDFGIPVVKVIVPNLEAMGEIPGYVPGARARRVMERAR
jgi:ribosomal protein S12 methylthiotransferase accessory factor